MVRTVCLDEKEHAVIIMRELNRMKEDDDLCDFIIKVKSSEYRVHKAILSAGSPFFKAMFKHATSKNEKGKVEMKDVDSECVKSCIDFMYCGKFDIPDGKIRQLLHVAIMMQLEKVKETIRSVLDKELNAENFHETRNIANTYNLQTLSTKCEKYFEENVIAISDQLGFANEPKSFLRKILKSKSLKLNEEEKLGIILKWAEDSPERSKDLLEMMKFLHLQQVSSNYLCDLLENHPLVSDNLHLYKLMSSHLVENVKKQGEKTAEDGDCNELIILFDSKQHCLQSYNPESEKVKKFHNENFMGFRSFNAASMDSYIYVLCGNKSVYRLCFKNKNSTWERMRDMITDHGSCPPCASLSGSLIVIASSYSATKDVELYNPVLNQWVKLREKPVAVSRQTLVSLGNFVYCVGGWDGKGGIITPGRSFCKFVPSTSEWIDLEPMKNARVWCGAVAVDQRIFVNGGTRLPSGRGKEVECYDVRSNQWTCLSPMLECQDFPVAHHFSGWMFAIGRNGRSNQIEKYDIKNDRWFKLNSTDINESGVCKSVMIRF